MSEKALTRSLGAVAALLVVAVYARALGVGFYSDDYEMLARMAPTVARPDFVLSVFLRDFNPLLHACFLLDYLAGGGASWPYHLSSIAAHAAVVLFVFFLATRLSGNPWIAFASAATWGVGVRISEAVIWPVSRGHVLAALFPLAAILLLRRDGAKRIVAASLLLVAGLLSKETALFSMLVAPWLIEDRALRRRVLVVVAVLAGAFVVLNFAIKPDFHTPNQGAWGTVSKLPFVVLRPLGLGDLYEFTALGFAVFVVAAAAVVSVTWRSPARAGVLWVLVCTLAVLPLHRVTSRYLYLLSAGIPLAVAGMARHPAVLRLSGGARRAVVGVVLTGAAILFVANAIFVQREIDDYRILAEPYARCLDALRPAALALAPGATLTVVETVPHTAIPELVRVLSARGNITKLIPERKTAVGGLIELSDAINIARGRGSTFAVATEPREEETRSIVTWAGSRVLPARGQPEGIARSARLVPVADYMRAARVSRWQLERRGED